MANLFRLDKFLCEQGIGSRSEVKVLLKKGLVMVNGRIEKSPDMKVDPYKDCIVFQGKHLQYQEFYYYMLHKPAGFITAVQDKEQKTVMSLLKEYDRTDLFPVGRLDKDTEGLLLITNDGALAHELLSPKKHVPKTYLVQIPQKLSEVQIKALEEGVDIGDEKKTLPAIVEVNVSFDEYSTVRTYIKLTICEGRYHQVKRMLLAVGSEVLYLKRISFGTLVLEDTLPKGGVRALTQAEIEQLRNRTEC